MVHAGSLPLHCSLLTLPETVVSAIFSIPCWETHLPQNFIAIRYGSRFVHHVLICAKIRVKAALRAHWRRNRSSHYSNETSRSGLAGRSRGSQNLPPAHFWWNGIGITQHTLCTNQSWRNNVSERSTLRNSPGSLTFKHEAVTGWKHRALFFVEQDGVQPMPKDRRAEQGDVDGPRECSLAPGVVASENSVARCGAASGLGCAVDWRGQSGRMEASRQTTKARCFCSETSCQVEQKNLQEQITHGMPYQKRRPSRLLVPW